MTKTVILGGLALGIALMLALAGITPASAIVSRCGAADNRGGGFCTACEEIQAQIAAGHIPPDVGAAILAKLGCPASPPPPG